MIKKNNNFYIISSTLNKQNHINVCFCTNDNYCWFTLLSINSILMTKNANTFIHIFIFATIEFIHQNKIYFETLETNTLKIQFIAINNNIFKIRKQCIYKDEIFYRFYIPNLLPDNISKVLYIDSDTIIQQDLFELFNIDITNFAFGAVYELGIMSYLKFNVDYEIFNEFQYLKKFVNYYNSGVLLCNLDFLRNDNFLKNCNLEYSNHDEYYFVDQDIINSLYAKNLIKSISYKYNFCFIPLVREDRQPSHTIKIFNSIYDEQFNSVDEAFNNAVILHFAFDKKLCSTFSICKKLYEKYSQNFLLTEYLK